MDQNQIDQFEYDTMMKTIGFVNEDIEEENRLEDLKNNRQPTEYEKLYQDIYKGFMTADEFHKKLEEKNFTKEETASLYQGMLLSQFRHFFGEPSFRTLAEEAMKYDVKNHYAFAMIPLLFDFYEGKDDEVKAKLKTLPENALSILLNGYYDKEDGKAVMDRLFSYDPVAFLVFSAPETERDLGMAETKVMSLNVASDEHDHFILANTFHLLLSLFRADSLDYHISYDRFLALIKILKQAIPPFEERLSEDMLNFIEYGTSDVVGWKDSDEPLFDYLSGCDDTFFILNDSEMMGRQITEEEFWKLFAEDEKLNLIYREDEEVDTPPDMKSMVRLPTFSMIFLDKYIHDVRTEKKIFANIRPGELPYYRISFTMKEPKGAIKRQFMVRYDTDLYTVCREFLYSVGVDETDHQGGFITEKSKYDCPFPSFFRDDSMMSDYIDSRKIRPYEIDSDTALFTYDYFQNWDFVMKVAKEPISKADCGDCVLKKATGYRLIPDAHNAFCAFYNGQTLPDYFSPFLKDEKGKFISRDVFFGPFKPEEVERVPHCYYESDEDEESEEESDQ